MKRCWKMVLSLVLTSLLLLAPAALAEDETIYEIDCDVEYLQSDARELLTLINGLRTSRDGGAWYWNEDGKTRTSFNVDGGETLEPLVYDCDLEEAAMQRAAELVFSYSFTRPDGTSGKTAYQIPENRIAQSICTGYESSEELYGSYAREDRNYDEQHVRRLWLDSDINAMAAAHMVFRDEHFWVLAYAKKEEPAPLDGTKEVTIRLSSSMLEGVEPYCKEDLSSMEAGKRYEFPKFYVGLNIKEHLEEVGGIFIGQNPEWRSSDPKVVSVEADGFMARKAGTAKLTASCKYLDYEVDVTVTGEAAGPVITLQPQNASVGIGEKAHFSVQAEGEGLTYQWLYSPPGSKGYYAGEPSDGAQSPEFSLTMDEKLDGAKVYCMVYNEYGFKTRTDIVLLTLPQK